MLIYYIFIYFLLSVSGIFSASEIELRACCQSGTKSEKCTKLEDAKDMIGIACCASLIYNTTNNICCQGKVHSRDRGGVMAHSCCGSEPLRLDQTCCSGKIHNIISGDCCGKDVYLKKDLKDICCNGVLSEKATPDDICCGSSSYDGGIRQLCCGDKVFEMTKADSCCQMNDGTMKEYKSSTHVCCDGPLEKASKKLACCYLRKDSKFINMGVAYHYDAHCTTKQNNAANIHTTKYTECKRMEHVDPTELII